jgi:hypothetical protein
MNSYLTGRTQFVELQHLDEKTTNIKPFASSCKEIKYGVPQGSVLGPLLFLFFINDLPQAGQDAQVMLFVNDTKKNRPSLKEKSVKVILIILIIGNFINSHILELNTSMFHSSIVTEHHYIISKQKHILEF